MAAPAATAYALSAATGVALWTSVALLGGRIEPWDAPGFWSVAYPLAIAMSGALGWAFPERAWRWALTLFLMQGVVMTARGAGLSMAPLGAILLTILALPAIGAATFAARKRLAS